MDILGFTQGKTKNGVIELIKKQLPEGTPEINLLLRSQGDLFLKYGTLDYMRKKISMVERILLIRKILALVKLKKYEFIECNINLETSAITGKVYHIENNQKVFKSFEI